MTRSTRMIENYNNTQDKFKLSKYRSDIENFRLPELKSIDEYRRYSFEDYLNDNDYVIESLSNTEQTSLLEHFYDCIANDNYNSYEGIVQPYLYEGLITSYDPFSFCKHIRKCYCNNIVNVYVEKHTLKVVVDCLIDDKDVIIELLSKDANTYGYYLASSGVDKQNKNIMFLCYETKYDMIDYTEGVYHEQCLNGIVYHITKKKYVDKILKIGLVAKSENKGIIYPERIYFSIWRGLKNFKFLAEQMNKLKNENYQYTLLKIDLKQHYIYKKFGTMIRMLNDPNNLPNTSFYTYENIPPNCIETICAL